MKKRITSLHLLIAAMFITLCSDMSATAQKTLDISGWPKASQDAAHEMMKKYGKPNETTATMLIWYNNGPWEKTVVYSKEIPHDFPKPHTDVMQQWVGLKVPESKFDQLA